MNPHNFTVNANIIAFDEDNHFFETWENSDKPNFIFILDYDKTVISEFEKTEIMDKNFVEYPRKGFTLTWRDIFLEMMKNYLNKNVFHQ